MAIQQVNSSYQNDGNFSMIEFRDMYFSEGGMRIESFRASHPNTGKFYRTAARTTAENLSGEDHLSIGSNRIFRQTFSVEDRKIREYIVTLEVRERFNEDGSWQVKIRDLDHKSTSYGAVVICTATPCKNDQNEGYWLLYEIYNMPQINYGYMMISPLTDKITRLDNRLEDIAKDNLGHLQSEVTIYVDAKTSQDETTELLADLVEILQQEMYVTFVDNVRAFQKFSNGLHRCIHTGQNLIGDNPQLVSEYMLVHPHYASLILLGKLFDMVKDGYLYDGFNLSEQKPSLPHNLQPGIYSTFILAHIVRIKVYQLALDKVYSDYGSIPMKIRPGSMFENGKKSIKSANSANRTLAELAVAFYEPHIAMYLR